MRCDDGREENIGMESKEESNGPSLIQFDQALWEVAKAAGPDAIQQYVHSLGCPYPLENQTDLLYWAAQLGLVHVFIHFAEGCNLKKIAPQALDYVAQGLVKPGYVREEESYLALWKYLVRKGFKPTEEEGKSRETPLHRLVWHGYLEMLKSIWPSLPSLNKSLQSNLYSTAVKHGHTPIVAFLEEQGITSTSSFLDAFAALCIAISKRDYATIEYFVEKQGAKKVGMFCSHPLNVAANVKDHDPLIFSYLINKGFNPKECDEYDRNALHFLAAHGHLESIQYLELDEELLTSKAKNAYSPLHLAAQYGHIDVVRYLIKQGGNPNETTPQDRETAYRLARKGGHNEVARFLAPYVNREKQAHLVKTCNAVKERKLEKKHAEQIASCIPENLLPKEIRHLVGTYVKKESPRESFFFRFGRQLKKIGAAPFYTFPEEINAQLQKPLRSILSPLLSMSPDAQIHSTAFFGRLLAHPSPSLHVLQQLQQAQEKKPFLTFSKEDASDMQEESKEDNSEELLLKRQQEISECSEAFYESCGKLQARIEKAAKLSFSQSCRQEQNTLRELLLEDMSILQCTLPSGISLGKVITPKLRSLLDFLHAAKQTLISSSTLMGRASCFIAEARGHANKETQEKYLQLMKALIDASDLDPAEKEALEKQYLKGEKVVSIKTEERASSSAMRM